LLTLKRQGESYGLIYEKIMKKKLDFSNQIKQGLVRWKATEKAIEIPNLRLIWEIVETLVSNQSYQKE
jgi:hypothetical protein